MADTLAKILPMEYIKPHDPVPQRLLNASRWFAVEILELDFGDYVGRPSQHAIIRVQLLTYLFANGWVVDAVQGGGEGGRWKSVGETDTSNKGTTKGNTGGTTDTKGEQHSDTKSEQHSSSKGKQHSDTKGKQHGDTKGKQHSDTNEHGVGTSNASSNSSAKSHASAYTVPWGDDRMAISNGSASTLSSGETSSETSTSSSTDSSTSSSTNSSTSSSTNSSTSSSTDSSTSSSTDSNTITNTVTSSSTSSNTQSSSLSKTSSEGPYWFAYVRIRLKRRKLQAELVMKDMVLDLTKAYNEGRKINDDRYDEIVALYSIMLGRTEDEGNNYIVTTADFKPLTDYVLQTMKKSVADFHAVADNLPDDVFKNRVKEINLKFDNQLSTARVELITAGLFNSTVWTTTASGIERNREMALNDLIETKIDVYVKVTNAAGDIGTRFMDAAMKLQQMAKQRLLDPAEMRNQVFKWMLDFMERRKDEFPGLDQIAGAARSLGYGETTTSNGVK